MALYAIGVGVFLLSICWVLWKNYMESDVVAIESDYYSLRYFYQFLYVALNALPYGQVLDLVQIMLLDGVLLSQITSMVMFNTTSFGLFVYSFVPLLMYLNCKLFMDIVLY